MPTYVIETGGPLWWTGDTWSPHRAAAKRFAFMSEAVFHAIEHIRDGRQWRTTAARPSATEDAGERSRR